MRWILAGHIIFVVCWFAGLFYLPRLFVYHAQTNDAISIDRFKVMERKLYRGIMMPSAILATFFGLWYLLFYWNTYIHAGWMYIKIALAALLWVYHFLCGKYLANFRHDRNDHSHRFYRFFNEIPTMLLIVIIILAIVKP